MLGWWYTYYKFAESSSTVRSWSEETVNMSFERWAFMRYRLWRITVHGDREFQSPCLGKQLLENTFYFGKYLIIWKSESFVCGCSRYAGLTFIFDVLLILSVQVFAHLLTQTWNASKIDIWHLSPEPPTLFNQQDTGVGLTGQSDARTTGPVLLLHLPLYRRDENACSSSDIPRCAPWHEVEGNCIGVTSPYPV